MEEFKKVKLLNPSKNIEDNERLIVSKTDERLILKKHTDALDRLHKILSGNDFLSIESRKNIFRDICFELVEDKIKDLSKRFDGDSEEECLVFIEKSNKIIEDEEKFLTDILINNNEKYQELIHLIFKYRLRH